MYEKKNPLFAVVVKGYHAEFTYGFCNGTDFMYMYSSVTNLIYTYFVLSKNL
jgi:hypothetical protein